MNKKNRQIKKIAALLLMGNIQSWAKAVKLKNKIMPDKLYHYRSVAAAENKDRLQWLIDVLEKGQIYCSPNDELNDPFDMRSVLSSKEPSFYTNTMSSYFDNNSEWFNFFRFSKFAKLFFSFQFSRNGISKEEIIVFNEQYDKLFIRPVEELSLQHDDFLKSLRIACFSESCESLPMWWFYADERRGVCLEYDVNKLEDKTKLFTFPVNYTRLLPDVIRLLHKLDTTSTEMDNTFNWFISTGVFPCIHKFSDWSYEKEWRYIMLNQENVFVNSPVRIILGDRVEESMKSKLLAVAHKKGIIVAQIKITPYGLIQENISDFIPTQKEVSCP